MHITNNKGIKENQQIYSLGNRYYLVIKPRHAKKPLNITLPL